MSESGDQIGRSTPRGFDVIGSDERRAIIW